MAERTGDGGGSAECFFKPPGYAFLAKTPLVMREGLLLIKDADKVGVALPSTGLHLMRLGRVARDCCYSSTRVSRGGTRF